MEQDGKFTEIKRKVVGASGIALLGCSIYLSKQGVGFVGDLWWMGLVVAVSLTCAELMFNSSFEELSWTMVVLGFGAYFYSIYTNIVGFYYYRHTGDFDLVANFNMTNVAGGFFMDVYPELAIAWAMNESKIGDLFGNLVKTYKNPGQLTKSFTVAQPGYQTQAHKVDGASRREQLQRTHFQPATKPQAQMNQEKRTPAYMAEGKLIAPDDEDM